MRNECVRLTFEVHLQPRTLTSYPPTRSPSPRTFFVLQLVVDQASSNQQPPKVIHAFLVLSLLVGTSWIWMWMMPSPSFFFSFCVSSATNLFISNKPEWLCATRFADDVIFLSFRCGGLHDTVRFLWKLNVRRTIICFWNILSRKRNDTRTNKLFLWNF